MAQCTTMDLGDRETPQLTQPPISSLINTSNIPQSSHSTDLPTFKYFGKLPEDVRLRVWYHGLPIGRLVVLHRRKYNRAQVADTGLRKTGFYARGPQIALLSVDPEARNFALKAYKGNGGGLTFRGLVDEGSYYSEDGGDKLLFASLEVLDVFASRYMGSLIGTGAQSLPSGCRGLDLTTISLRWDPDHSEDSPSVLPTIESSTSLGGSTESFHHALWKDIPRHIGRLLEIMEQLGVVETVVLVHREVGDMFVKVRDDRGKKVRRQLSKIIRRDHIIQFCCNYDSAKIFARQCKTVPVWPWFRWGKWNRPIWRDVTEEGISASLEIGGENADEAFWKGDILQRAGAQRSRGIITS